mmetsp:Transcript_21548/g.44943  ORF Transcript_21548/g.44943 Transcript_21548/m.44943 type:complete len:415 (+) Transcript_21548:133-1377(+)
MSNDDIVSVSSSDDEPTDLALFARAKSAPYTYKGTTIVAPNPGKKTVLVTGGAGFIGSHVSDTLLSRGDSVVILDELNDYYDPNLKDDNLAYLRSIYDASSLTFVKGDICDEELLDRVFKDYKVDHVCHLAARAGVRPSIEDPQIYVHSNIRGTTALLMAAAKHGVKNFVYASSSSVYGGSKSTFFSEDEAVDMPVSPYAASKKACELIAHTYSHLYNLPCTGLRFFTVFGERGRPDMAPYKFIDRISRGEPMQQFGDGSSSRDYTYISDIVDGVVRSIDRPYKYQVFNLGKGSGTTLKDFISIVEKYTGKKANKTILPDQPGDVPRTCASTEKAAALLGYEAKVPFDEGIRRTVLWYNAKNSIANCAAVESSSVAAMSTRKRRRSDEGSKVGIPPNVSMDNLQIPGNNLAATF